MEVRAMFLEYFGLLQQPFGEARDSTEMYASRTYTEAREWALRSILGDRGSLAVTAEPGMGKTALLAQLQKDLNESGRIVFLLQGRSNAREILQLVLSQMGSDTAGMDLPAMQRRINEIWFAEVLAGKRFVLLFDDAEQLTDEALETLGLLSKYETSYTKLVQLVLCGQAELLKQLDQNRCALLRKHIVEVHRLGPMSALETAGYIRHCLFAAGHRGHSLFDPEALVTIAALSQGVPKDINRICSRALLEAYARGMHVVAAEIVEKADRNLAGTPVTVSAPVLPRQVFAQLSYKLPKPYGLPGSGLWVGAVLGVLLSAGLALPHGMLRNVKQMMSGPDLSASAATNEEQPQAIPEAGRNQLDTPTPAQPSSAAKRLATNSLLRKTTGAITGESAQLSLTRELGLKINRIVIDPGHGGFDTGAKGPHGLLEKDLCLDVALQLGEMIRSNIPGAEVIYTRKDDSYVPLEDRTAMANNADADLFISIHANSSDYREVRGVETYYLSLATSKEAKELAIRENAMTQSSLHDLPDLVQKITQNEKIGESKLLAAQIQDTLSERLQLVSRGERNRGVKQAPFIVLAGANMPAVLSEISFVSNANDETLLLEAGQRQRIADGLYRGIAAYLDGLHGIPQNRQKLVTENRVNVLGGFERATTQSGRNPL
jgi:N-acetylmuramoyl-L-alanine amidase